VEKFTKGDGLGLRNSMENKAGNSYQMSVTCMTVEVGAILRKHGGQRNTKEEMECRGCIWPA
jgi:hypothetical protein